MSHPRKTRPRQTLLEKSQSKIDQSRERKKIGRKVAFPEYLPHARHVLKVAVSVPCKRGTVISISRMSHQHHTASKR